MRVVCERIARKNKDRTGESKTPKQMHNLKKSPDQESNLDRPGIHTRGALPLSYRGGYQIHQSTFLSMPRFAKSSIVCVCARAFCCVCVCVCTTFWHCLCRCQPHIKQKVNRSASNTRASTQTLAICSWHRHKQCLNVVVICWAKWGLNKIGRFCAQPPSKKKTHTHTQTQLWFFGVAKPTTNAATGARSKVARVRAEYPNQLDYIGFWGALSEEMLPEFVSDRRAIF